MTIFEYLLIAALSLLPALFWVGIFRYLNRGDRVPTYILVRAFAFGIVSMLPVLFLNQLFTLMPELNVFALLMDRWGPGFTFYTSFFGFVALFEEAMKILALVVFIRFHAKFFNQVVDGVFFGALVALGFGFMENLFFFDQALQTFSWSGNFLALFNLRSFGTMVGHVVFTGLFGYYYGLAYFSPFLHEPKKKRWNRSVVNLSKAVVLHSTFFYLLPGRKHSTDSRFFERSTLFLEGYFLASFAHFLFNAFIKVEFFGVNVVFFTVPLVTFGVFFLFGRYFVPAYYRRFKMS